MSRGSDRNSEAISNATPEPDVEGFAQHTLVTCWKIMTPRCLFLPAEQSSMTGEPGILLPKRQAKQSLTTTTERILEVRASTSGSDLTVASFTDDRLDLTVIAGRHGIEIADQVSSAAGWNPLSSSGCRGFWHVHFVLAPKLIIYSLPSVSEPSKVAQQSCFKFARDQLHLYVRGMYWQHVQGSHFLLDTSTSWVHRR